MGRETWHTAVHGSQRVGHDWETELNWRSFFYSSSVHSCHLLISSVSVRSLSFLSFIMPNLVCNVALISLIFLIALYSLSFYCFSLCLFTVRVRRPSYISLLFPRTLHTIGYIFSFPPCLLFLFCSQLLVRPPQTTISPSSISFSLGWFWSPPPVQC